MNFIAINAVSEINVTTKWYIVIITTKKKTIFTLYLHIECPVLKSFVRLVFRFVANRASNDHLGL